MATTKKVQPKKVQEKPKLANIKDVKLAMPERSKAWYMRQLTEMGYSMKDILKVV